LYDAEPDASRTPYVDCHPPPNATGRLHTGHALNLAVGDTLIRWRRLQGYNVLIQPGFDHAGIATQNVVEKALLDEGTSRRARGRGSARASRTRTARAAAGRAPRGRGGATHPHHTTRPTATLATARGESLGADPPTHLPGRSPGRLGFPLRAPQ